jgi:hypothetical protein
MFAAVIKHINRTRLTLEIQSSVGFTRASQARPAPGLLEVIKLIVQVFEEILHFARGEFLFCRMTAGNQLLFERIQRLNLSVFASEDVGLVAFHAVGVEQALPLGAIARQ